MNKRIRLSWRKKGFAFESKKKYLKMLWISCARLATKQNGN